MTQPPSSPSPVPADDATDYWTQPLATGAEPTATGTLFFVIVILMIIAAIWVIMYLRLLDR